MVAGVDKSKLAPVAGKYSIAGRKVRHDFKLMSKHKKGGCVSKDLGVHQHVPRVCWKS